MTDFVASWELSRQRFVNEIGTLTDAQMQWRPFDGTLSIGQMALHVAGVEVSFSTQLMGGTLTQKEAKLKSAATCGVVNDEAFPFLDAEITTELVLGALDHAKTLVEPIITEPSPEILQKELKSALGPIITGYGALARFAFHPAYHQGQAYLYKQMPEFPGSPA
jgi:hypothetical protein